LSNQSYITPIWRTIIFLWQLSL